MKILHTLVSYLAATALPFHPFAFASLLAAIDYDGYANTQNHTGIDGALIMLPVLGSIVGTCQTVTMQNHRASALIMMKRVSGDIIEARQAEYATKVLTVITIVVAITLSILWVEDNDSVGGNDLIG